MLMIRALCPTGPCTPKSGSKNRHRQEEENARHLQTHDAAHADERTQKPADAARHALGSLSRRAATHAGDSRRWSSKRFFTDLSARGHALAGHSPSHTQPDAQDTSNLLRSHSVMMVAVDVAEPLFSVCLRFAVDPERQRK